MRNRDIATESIDREAGSTLLRCGKTIIFVHFMMIMVNNLVNTALFAQTSPKASALTD